MESDHHIKFLGIGMSVSTYRKLIFPLFALITVLGGAAMILLYAGRFELFSFLNLACSGIIGLGAYLLYLIRKKNKEAEILLADTIGESDEPRVKYMFGIIDMTVNQYRNGMVLVTAASGTAAAICYFQFQAETRWLLRNLWWVFLISAVGSFGEMMVFLIKQKRDLEVQLKERMAEIKEKNALLKDANKQIADKNKDITDSIRYAENIQRAILPKEQEIRKFIPNHFIYFQPKDIVSGDFYWFGYKHSISPHVIVPATVYPEASSP